MRRTDHARAAQFDSVPIRLQPDRGGDRALRRAPHEFPGVDIRTRLTRHYPHGALGRARARLRGRDQRRRTWRRSTARSYAGTSLIGKLGVEAAYEDELHGRNGYREILVNAQGRSVEQPGRADAARCEREAPVAGHDLMLSIDLPRAAGRRGSGSATGAARSSRSTRTPATCWRWPAARASTRTLFAPRPDARRIRGADRNIDKPLFNRALRGTYPPGSTIKPVMALAALPTAWSTPQQARILPGVFHAAGQQRTVPRRQGRRARRGGPVARPSRNPATSISTPWPRRWASTASPSSWRPSGSASSPASTSAARRSGLLPSPRVEEEGLQATRRPGVVPRRDGELRHRPGLHAGHADAAGARGGGASPARPELQAAAGDRRCATRCTGKTTTPTGAACRSVQVRHARAVGAWSCEGMRGRDHGGTAARHRARRAKYPMAGKTGTAQVFTVGAEREVHRARMSTSGCATTPGSSPSRRPRRRRSRWPCWWRTAASAPASPRPSRARSWMPTCCASLPERRTCGGRQRLQPKLALEAPPHDRIRQGRLHARRTLSGTARAAARR